MTRLVLFSFLIILASSALAERQSYSGFQVIKASADSLDDLLYLQNHEHPGRLIIWDFGPGDDDKAVSATFHVHPALVEAVKSELTQRGLPWRVVVEDLQEEIDVEQTENIKAQSNPANVWFDSYHNYDEIMAWMDELAETCGTRCETFSIGNSFEGRQLKVFKLTGAPNSCTRKRAVWIDAGIHAREWIAHSTGLFLMDRLVTEYATDPFVRQMRDNYDWYFLPVVNPDGYSYSWASDRLWRKSRRPNPGSTCIGTDVNRNFDHMWNTVGTSTNPCSETFAGSGAYSEPEARLLASYVNGAQLARTWDLFITLHTYGQLFMAPWGYTTNRPATYNELIRVGQAGVNGIRSVHGVSYTLGSASEILYTSSGTSRDWAYGVPNIPYVYTIELRNLNSFVLPPAQIRPTGEEIWMGVKEVVRTIWQVRPPACAP